VLQCNIDNKCRVDVQAALGTGEFTLLDPSNTSLRHCNGVDCNTGSTGNKCYKCDSDVDPGAWTEYARGARCQLCSDIGKTDTVEYDVKPGDPRQPFSKTHTSLYRLKLLARFEKMAVFLQGGALSTTT
jgi:hypothetical protein